MAVHGTPGPRVPAGALAAALFLIAACSGGAREQPTAAASTGAGEEAPVSQENGSAPLTPIPIHGPAVSAEPSASASGKLAWTVPEGFMEEPPNSSMRKAQYRVPAVSGDTENGE